MDHSNFGDLTKGYHKKLTYDFERFDQFLIAQEICHMYLIPHMWNLKY